MRDSLSQMLTRLEDQPAYDSADYLGGEGEREGRREGGREGGREEGGGREGGGREGGGGGGGGGLGGRGKEGGNSHSTVEPLYITVEDLTSLSI